MNWLSVFVVFLIAVLSGMGVGSAGLLVAYLTAFADVPQITAQGINLLRTDKTAWRVCAEPLQ